MMKVSTLYRVDEDALKTALARIEKKYGKLRTRWAYILRLTPGQLGKRCRGELGWQLDELMVLEKMSGMPVGSLYHFRWDEDKDREAPVKEEEGVSEYEEGR